MAPRLHRHLVESVARALVSIFDDRRYADKVIEYQLKNNPKWGSRDRRFFAEAVYDIVRWWRWLWWVREKDATVETRDLFEIFAIWWIEQGYQLPPWPEFSKLNVNQVHERLSAQDLPRAIRESIPDWMDELGAADLGSRWDSVLSALNEPAAVILRANRLKVDRDQLRSELLKEEIETELVEDTPDALRLKERKNVHKTIAFKNGLFEVQDSASQWVAPLLAPQPGERVIDACAGAGGKALHLAALMRNKGKILALDVEDKKLEELRRRCSRAGVQIVEAKVIDSTKVIKRLAESADAVLLDVPCTGLGVLRRNPDAKWKMNLEGVQEVHQKQRDILSLYSKMVKPGGRLVYATCSILKQENEAQVEWFLSQSGIKWILAEEKRGWPDEGHDGFYMALLKRDH